jgi:hypothetical protein
MAIAGRMNSTTRTAALCLLALSSACTPREMAAACPPEPLANYGSPPPAYDDALAAQQGCCMASPTAGSSTACEELVTSTCGVYRVIAIGGLGLGSYTKLYYDAAGTNVGVRVWSDTSEFCNQTRFSQAYGNVPTCDETSTVVCQRPGYIRPIAGVE